jgi:general nucleoside transport system ATP-binding protein
VIEPEAIPAPSTPLVELADIRKSYGDLLVNDGVNLTLHAGEVHALLGENGAGKTTLMRILFGLTRPDAGTIRVDGRLIDVTSPAAAIAAGIGMVTQHFALVGPMTVTENVLLSSVGAGIGRVDRRVGRQRVVAAAERIGVRVDPDARVDRLSVGEQQRVEILKALSRDCRVLILDEPTAVLVPQDIDALFASIRRLTDTGLGVLFISHKLREVSAISDRVSVLRRGQVIDTVPTAGASASDLAQMMVGRPTVGVRRADRPAAVLADDLDLATARAVDEQAVGGPVNGAERPERVEEAGAVLVVRDVRLGGRSRAVLDGVDLIVRAGEIVGVAGVSGNGQTELVEVLCGLQEPASGSVEVNGNDVTGADPAEVIAAGLGRLTEDRHASLVPRLSVEQNLVLEDLPAFRRRGLLDGSAIRLHASALIERFSIKAAPTDPVSSLSGGNMQKVLLARALARDPVALVASQPTRGLDVGAAEFVHTELLSRRAAGGGVLLISEDLEELLALADRIVVMFEGRLVGELPATEATPEALGLLMAGQAA